MNVEIVCCHVLKFNAEHCLQMRCVIVLLVGSAVGCGWCWFVLWCFVTLFRALAILLILVVSQVNGKQYFDCPQSHGLFMRAKVGPESTKFAAGS